MDKIRKFYNLVILIKYDDNSLFQCIFFFVLSKSLHSDNCIQTTDLALCQTIDVRCSCARVALPLEVVTVALINHYLSHSFSWKTRTTLFGVNWLMNI